LNEKILIFFAEFREARNFFRPHLDDVDARCQQGEKLVNMISLNFRRMSRRVVVAFISVLFYVLFRKKGKKLKAELF
jgi:hypothetical protein